MSYRRLYFLAVPVAALVTLAFATPPAAAQSGDAAAGHGGVPATAWGDPDLQGTWASSGATPMERPDEYQGRERLSDEEVALARAASSARDEELLAASAQRTQAGGNVGAYNNFWMDRGARSNRTSMIVDPPDGRFPPLTPEGEAAMTGRPRGDDTWEDRHIWERCVTRGGMPNAMFPRSYNNNVQIFQAPGVVALLIEQVHEVRIVPLDERPVLRESIGQWNGDSRGHWDGNTLVVETRNLDHRVSALQPWSIFNSASGSGEGLTLVERFTRTDADTLEYEVEVNDPQMYTRPWTVAFPFEAASYLLYEYACHEGNVGMEGILSGGRADDAAEAK
jgi:hypothetical protein